MYIEKIHEQTLSIIFCSWGFSNLDLRYRFFERINCILALTFLAVDTLINILRENIPNFVTLKTFGLNVLIALAQWQRFDPTCRRIGTWWVSDWYGTFKTAAWDCILPQYCTTLGKQPAVYPSLHHLEEKKQQQKILGTHSVLAKACVGELPTWAKLSLASKKKLADSEAYDSLSLCFHFLSESENHINLQNSCTFSNAILFMPLKASRSTIRFPVKIQLGFQFNFRVISGELKDPRDLWYCENKKHL